MIPINYIEFKTNDLSAVKDFYSAVFGWTFTDYGNTYTAFSNSGVEGGFELSSEPIQNGVLVVLHHKNLESLLGKVKSNGGQITKEIFSFPGGKRFQFVDPTGNEVAVWCEVQEA